MNRRLCVISSILAVASGLAPPAASAGQSVVSDGVELEKVDESIEDADALSSSMRELRSDLRQPVGFEDVFRAVGNDEMLIRVQGGTFAVFPRSVYVNASIGPVPLIPGGTVFYTGRESLELAGILEPRSTVAPYQPYLDPAGQRVMDLGPPGASRIESRLDLPPLDSWISGESDAAAAERGGPPLARPERAFRPAPPPGETTPDKTAAQSTVAVTIATDGAYRTRRIGALIRRAAQAARGESSSSSK